MGIPDPTNPLVRMQPIMKFMATCNFLVKKPFPIVLLAIFCLSQGISQERERITNQDEDGTIILEGEIDIYNDKIDTVWVRLFNSNGKKIEEKKFKNGKLHGDWEGWYSDGSKKFIKKYRNGMLRATQREWYPNGELLKVIIYELGVINGVYNEWWNNGEKKVEGQYKDGKKRGQWTHYDAGRKSRYDFYRRSGEFLASYNFKYYANGQIKEEPSFVNRKAEGIWLRYSEGGNTIMQLEYLKGRKHGTWIKWWENGEKKEEGLYLGNKKEEQWTYYDSGRRSRYNFFRSDELLASYDFEYYANGQLKEEPSFNIDGVREGKWIQYFEGGEKKSQELYTNATPNGLWITWHESTSEKASERTYVDGILEDEFREWWDNGEKKVEGQYAGNKKEGVWMNYDPGRRSRIDFYRSDELFASYDFEYYANGQLKEEPSFKDGVRDGEWIQYFESGKKKSEEMYANAKPNGLWTTWHESTFKKESERTYRRGNLDKGFREWWENGKIKTEGQYLVNKKEGAWMNYDPGRRLRYEHYTTRGELISSYDFKYYDNGQLKEEPSFNEDGVWDGEWIQYFWNGKKKSKEVYTNATPNGLWITWHDSTFKKESERIYIDGILENEYSDWWDNGDKKTEGQYAGDKKEGVWMHYYRSRKRILVKDENSKFWERGVQTIPNRRSRYELYRSDELVSSYDFEYYENGQLKEEPSFNIDGLWDGDWIRYFEGGEKASQRGYGNGRPDGLWITWHDSTFVKVQEMTYKDSLLEDKYFEWWMDEKPKVTGFYVHGKKDSKWSYWDKFAHQRFEIYEMDELLFKWGWEYYDNNQVKEEFEYIKTGVLHGEWYAYYKDGSHRGFRGYDNGLRNGAWIDWYTNGQKSFERKYELDQPVDKWFYWYFFGDLMSEVQYENNEIVGQQCFQSSFMYSKPAEELRDCSGIVDPRYINRGVFRIYSPSKVLIKETFINDDELLAQFEYHDNSEPSTIKLFRQGEIIFFKRWNPEGIEIIDDPDPSGLFSSWDYYLNGNVKYKVTYMGIEKKEKHGIEWSYYNDRTWEKINLFYRGELKLSRKWTHGASISVDTLYQDGKKVYVN